MITMPPEQLEAVIARVRDRINHGAARTCACDLCQERRALLEQTAKLEAARDDALDEAIRRCQQIIDVLTNGPAITALNTAMARIRDAKSSTASLPSAPAKTADEAFEEAALVAEGYGKQESARTVQMGGAKMYDGKQAEATARDIAANIRALQSPAATRKD